MIFGVPQSGSSTSQVRSIDLAIVKRAKNSCFTKGPDGAFAQRTKSGRRYE